MWNMFESVEPCIMKSSNQSVSRCCAVVHLFSLDFEHHWSIQLSSFTTLMGLSFQTHNNMNPFQPIVAVFDLRPLHVRVRALIRTFSKLLHWISGYRCVTSSLITGLMKARLLQRKLSVCLQETICAVNQSTGSCFVCSGVLSVEYCKRCVPTVSWYIRF